MKMIIAKLKGLSGKEEEISEFLESLPQIAETKHKAWYTYQFGSSSYGIIAVDPQGSNDISDSQLEKVLMSQSGNLFEQGLEIRSADILADKMPDVPTAEDSKALLLAFKAKEGKEKKVEDFLVQAKSEVYEEPDTTSWFALRLHQGEYGIFGTFADSASRFKHLTGEIPRALANHASSLLVGFPDLDMLDLLEESFEDVTATTRPSSY
jgi:hypothetical protein